jgi:UDP-N-acetylglucosamine--N-acetylmuramyl-(pentapeptide) pyrophosphoryl-undecaprenol N-acetylglucosamine transferase
MKKKHEIVIVAGGSGGHVFPAISLADQISEQYPGLYEILFITDKRGEKYLGKYSSNCIIQSIDTKSRLSLYFSLILNISKFMISAECCLICDAVRKFFAVKKDRGTNDTRYTQGGSGEQNLRSEMMSNQNNKSKTSVGGKIIGASCVIGFGGYPSIPPLIVAKILGKRVFIHEQNAVVGKANKLLSKLSDKILLSFKDTRGLNKSHMEKCVLVGNPTRFESLYDRIEYKPNTEEFKIFIVGGSQGAKIFSSHAVDAICNVSQKIQKQFKKIFVYQQTKEEDISCVKLKYEKSNIGCEVRNFFTDIDSIFRNVDLVISRSGSSSIFEIVGFKRPSILVPYKYSINGDQLCNAKIMQQFGCSRLIEEDELSERLVEDIIQLIENPHSLIEMSRNTLSLMISSPSKKISEMVFSTLCE